MQNLLIKKNSIYTVILCFVSILLFTSCKDGAFFDQFQSTNGTWKRGDIKKFTFEQKDTVGRYDILIRLRTNEAYPFSNIFLIVKTYGPEEQTMVDTVQYVMANPDGTLMGNGFTDTKLSDLYFRENFRFKTPGVYKLEIEHAIRNADDVDGVGSLDGITDVGVIIEKKK